MDLTISINQTANLASLKLQSLNVRGDYRTEPGNDTPAASPFVGPSRVPPAPMSMPLGMHPRVVSGSQVRHRSAQARLLFGTGSTVTLSTKSFGIHSQASWRVTQANPLQKSSCSRQIPVLGCDCQSPDTAELMQERTTPATVVALRFLETVQANGK